LKLTLNPVVMIVSHVLMLLCFRVDRTKRKEGRVCRC